ncbi:Hsp20 family protein [Chitinophaga sedimenti]
MPDEVQQENIEASYTDGVLMVKLPKKENARKAALSKHIAVK